MISSNDVEEVQSIAKKRSRFLGRICELLIFVGTGYLLLIVYGDRPLVAEPWQWADDGLYLKHGEAFAQWLQGDSKQWLGPYDAIMLSKAPLFGVWIGLLHTLHIPLRLAEFGMLLGLPWLFRAAVRPMLYLSGWRLLPFMILLIGLPFLPQEQRLLRSALHVAVASGCLISAVGMILRSRLSGVSPVRWAISTGFLFALSYLNREETIWLLPVVASALSAMFIGACAQRKWRTAMSVIVGVSFAFAVPVSMVVLLNYQAYGIAVTTLRRAPAFTKAHQVMTSLDPDGRERYVPITTATRHKAYSLSPTFSRLQTYLEGTASDPIATNSGHLALNGRAEGTREFFVSNFEFVLREAAFAAGAKTASSSEDMFETIRMELDACIEAGKFTSGNHGPALMAAAMPGDNLEILKSSVASLKMLYTLKGMVYPQSGFSSGLSKDLKRMEKICHTHVAPTQTMAPVKPQWPNFKIRSVLFYVFSKFQAAIYLIGTLTVVVYAFLVVVRHRSNPVYWERGFAGLVLFGSLFAFSLAMSVVNVLGFPILQYAVTYNCFGFIPLSVLGAFGLALLLAWVPPCVSNGTPNK